MAEKTAHWIESSAVRRKFWAYAKSDLGLTEDEVHDALGVESTKDFDGNKTGAMALLQNYAIGIVPRRARLLLDEQEPKHTEARVIAFCDLYTPGGTRISLTAREGAQSDDLVATALALVDASTMLVNIFGFGAAPQKYAPANNKQPAAKSPTPTRPTPLSAPGYPVYTNAPVPLPPGNAPPPPAGHSHPIAPALPPAPPAGNGQSQPQGGIIQAEFVRITAPKGKPVVEFWRPNRKYAEIRWQLGGEKLLAIAPALAAAQWQVTHFGAEAVGQEYQLPVNVHWVPSYPDGKYKDITLVELR